MPHADPSFPALHGRPDAGWLNDPNGCAYVDGVYHVFFQYNPEAPVHSRIHWGHATSTDLVRWTEQPIALFPREGADDDAGCWSGVVALDGDVPTAYYTGIAETADKSVVMTATSDRRMLAWQQAQQGIAGMPAEPGIGQVRDPFLFTFEGTQYAIQGSGYQDGTPAILLYRCTTMTDWEYLGPLLAGGSGVAGAHAAANIWECPQLFDVDGQWVLSVALWHNDGGTHRLDGVAYLYGDLSEGGAGLKFLPQGGGRVDTGADFYAPQVLAASAEEPRTLLWGWSWDESRPAAEVATAGWAGALTYARELSFGDGVLRSQPVAEVATLRAGKLFAGGQDFAVPSAERAFEVVSDGAVQLVFATGAGEEVVAELARGGRILVDGSLLETFTSDGAAVTRRAYPGASSSWLVRPLGAPVVVHRLAL
ncbi:glycoside hydrolase family 32 protein [Pseudarthrobacter sp. P1]|uniref:glycoside hydrolase family 32 protein n=1 Tax=Pseudarthrobacter sp. P1 TaxID=3418418 RepID=UPI003CEEF4E3